MIIMMVMMLLMPKQLRESPQHTSKSTQESSVWLVFMCIVLFGFNIIPSLKTHYTAAAGLSICLFDVA